MLRQLTSSQLSELEALWVIEGGWGDWKQDYRIGQLTAIQAEPYRDKKRRAKPYKPADFALRPSEPTRKKKKKQGNKSDHIRKQFDMLAQMAPAKDKKKKK